MGSPYYSELELCGGVVMVCFSKYLPWQAMHFLQSPHTLLINVLQTIWHKLKEDSGTGSFDIRAPFSWLEKPSNLMGRDLDCMGDVLMEFH
jgi:hypothetical protein